MTKRKSTRIPSLRHCNGRGFVEMHGRRIYLGPWNAPETTQAYERTIAEWLQNGKRLPTGSNETTVSELCLTYFLHCQRYYQKPDETRTSSFDIVKQALRPLRKLYGDTNAAEYTPSALRTTRSTWVEKGLARNTVNKYTSEVKRAFKWGVAHELVPESTSRALEAVEYLKAWRSDAPETEGVRSVAPDDINAIEPFVSSQVWALVQLQLLTGARGGELLGLRPIDLDTRQETWQASLVEHKTAHASKARILYFGPKAREILRQFMEARSLDAPLFSPREAEQKRYADAPGHRRHNQKPTPRRTNRTIGDHYTPDSYRRAIVRACSEANIPPWTPHQLRHNAATLIRRDHGLEAAQVILGHSRADVTQLYAEVDKAKALAVIEEIG